MLSDVSFPATMRLDTDSRYTFYGARHGNAFCGLMSVPDGVVYLVPYRHTLVENRAFNPSTVGDLTEYPKEHRIRVAGTAYKTIYHQEGDSPGHEQLMKYLNEIGIRPRNSFVGFSMLLHSKKRGFGNVSRSQNNQHFRKWTSGSQDKAFAHYRGLTGDSYGPPTFHDVTILGGGELPPAWANRIKFFLKSQLKSEWFSHVDVKITTPQMLTDSSVPTPNTNMPAPQYKALTIVLPSGRNIVMSAGRRIK